MLTLMTWRLCSLGLIRESRVFSGQDYVIAGDAEVWTHPLCIGGNSFRVAKSIFKYYNNT